MKRYYILLLFSVFCFSQNKVLTIKEIDSICSIKGTYGNADGVIEVKQNNKIIGSGGSSTSFYINHYNEENYNNLSREEKKYYNIEKNSELIKGRYSEGVVFNNGNIERFEGHFYYYDKKLFFVKIKVLKKENDKEQSQEFYITEDELSEGKPIKNILLFDAQAWTRKNNLEILKFYNHK